MPSSTLSCAHARHRSKQARNTWFLEVVCSALTQSSIRCSGMSFDHQSHAHCPGARRVLWGLPTSAIAPNWIADGPNSQENAASESQELSTTHGTPLSRAALSQHAIGPTPPVYPGLLRNAPPTSPCARALSNALVSIVVSILRGWISTGISSTRDPLARNSSRAEMWAPRLTRIFFLPASWSSAPAAALTAWLAPVVKKAPSWAFTA